MKDRNLINKFYLNNKGSVSIEFVFMLIFLVVIFAFLADLVIVRSTTGKLDNVSYSLVNILRERTQLYDRETRITNQDLKDFEQLAKRLVYGDKESKKEIHIVLEHWQEGNSSSKRNSSQCKPYREIRELSQLSPRSEINNERKIPLYQVTLCVETNSFFKALLLDKANQSLGMIRSSSFSVSR
ncbi:protein TadF [Rodentibacter genomosp. 2]|uniref:tight adherence pilus pseudopilin TadF n=1 Tax=Rodentibacter genomosp. 2 TaxID=1908266 RepID=UPI000986E3D0|nr:protein TadF [Rodentibacter genomosp. 2]